MTLAFWQAGDYSAAARAVRDWIRAERERPAPYRYAARIYEDMGALSQAVDAAERETAAAPSDASAWERLGRLRLRALRPRGRARGARARPRDRAVGAGPARPRARGQPVRRRRRGGDGLRAGHRARAGVAGAWARYAHALARTDRISRLPGGVRAGAAARRRPRGARPARAGRPRGAPRELVRPEPELRRRPLRAPRASTRRGGGAPRRPADATPRCAARANVWPRSTPQSRTARSQRLFALGEPGPAAGRTRTPPPWRSWACLRAATAIRSVPLVQINEVEGLLICSDVDMTPAGRGGAGEQLDPADAPRSRR